MGSALRLKFWGTRGLISSPHKNTAIYGGNTSCIQLLHKSELIIIDTGFGVTNLGEVLMPRILAGQESLTVHIFYTHFHWDHIQGLPFFHPIYFPTSTLNLYSPLATESIKENLDLLFDGSYSPFAGVDSMPSQVNFITIKDRIEVSGLKISYCPLDHGWHEANTYAYKFEEEKTGISLVVASDHEARPSPINDRFIAFANECDLLVHDAQYTEKEYKEYVGWGHSSMKQALENSLKSKAKRTLLSHHDPKRTDDELKKARKKYSQKATYKDLDFDFAKESVIYNLEKK